MTLFERNRDDVALNVESGAKLLDGIEPEWFKVINLHELDLQKCNTCVIGQLYGSMEFGVREIANKIGGSFEFMIEEGVYIHGFDLHSYLAHGDNAVGYEGLTNMWKQEIMKRRNVTEA